MSLIRGEDRRFILIRLAVVVGIVGILCLIALIGMGMVNDKLGVSSGDSEQNLEEGIDPFATPDSLWMPDGGTELPQMAVPSEGPESSWEVMPCSLYTSGTSEAVLDSLPMAPSSEDKPFEALMLVKRWAEEYGIQDDYIDKVYVFNNYDTIYVDLPSVCDIDGLSRTLESRFICFTRLYPLVAGNIMSAYPDGVPLRGVPGVFR